MLAEEIDKVLAPVAKPLAIDPAQKPHVILVVGVNGTGKTTTIGKLAAKLRGEGRGVVLAAGDTFRAAAIEQLKIWGERTGARVVAARAGRRRRRPRLRRARRRRRKSAADVLLIDTAGRLQNKDELMAELEKIVRVLRKLDPAAPHSVLLTLDATTGQNALQPGRDFRQARRRHRPRHDQARRHRPRRHPRRHRRRNTACRSISSASAKASTTSSRSRRTISPRRWRGLQVLSRNPVVPAVAKRKPESESTARGSGRSAPLACTAPNALSP